VVVIERVRFAPRVGGDHQLVAVLTSASFRDLLSARPLLRSSAMGDSLTKGRAACVVLMLGVSGCRSGASEPECTPSPPRLLIPTTWKELDAPKTRPLLSGTDDCFAQGFNLNAVLAFFPTDHDDTLRTDAVSPKGWDFVKDEPVHVTVLPSTDLTKATCSAPVKSSGCCNGEGLCVCRRASMPTINFEATVHWSASGAEPTVFVASLVATPAGVDATSGDRMDAPVGWGVSWVRYSVSVAPDGLGGYVDNTGCSSCTDYVQRFAAFPPWRSLSTRLRQP
jgi:hypothetical protein